MALDQTEQFIADLDLLFLMEKYYLEMHQQSQSPEAIMRIISANYNVPIDAFSDQIRDFQTVYETVSRTIFEKMKSVAFASAFNQFFRVESPTDFSLGIYLYLLAKGAHPFQKDQEIEAEELKKRIHLISYLLNDSFENLNSNRSISALTKYLWHYPTTDEKKWSSILVLYHAQQLTEQLFRLIGEIKADLPAIDQNAWPDTMKIDSEKAAALIAHLVGDTDNKQVIRIPSMTCFNATKVLEDNYSGKIYIVIGVFYNALGKLIAQYDQNDKIVVSRLKAIGDSRRLEILKTLKQHQMCGKDIAHLLGLTPATVSHHMNSLVNCGLVTIQKVGTRIDYKINEEETRKLIHAIELIFLSGSDSPNQI